MLLKVRAIIKNLPPTIYMFMKALKFGPNTFIFELDSTCILYY